MNKTEKITLEQKFHEHLQTHEPLKLALFEAVWKFYFDNCLERLNTDDKEFLNVVSNLFSTLFHEYPDWHYRLKNYLSRYKSADYPVTQIPLPFRSWQLTSLKTSYKIELGGIAAKEWNYHSKWEYKNIFESKTIKK